MKIRLLVGVAAVVLLAACSGATPVAAPGAGSPAGAVPTDAMNVPDCPAWDAEPNYPEGNLSAGATSIRICPGEKAVRGSARWQPALLPPVDALITGVEQVVGDLNALPDWEGLPAGTFCSQESQPRVHYVVGYPGGMTRSVTYGYGECGLLELGSPGKFPAPDTRAKVDAAPFIDSVAEGIVEQRRHARPPADLHPAPRCVPNARSYTPLPVQDLQLTVGALCLLDGQDWRRAVLPPALIDRLAQEYAAAVPGQPECPTTFSGKVAGWSTWGDPIELQLHGRCAMAGSPGTLTAARWSVSAGLAEDLAALALGPRVKQR